MISLRNSYWDFELSLDLSCRVSLDQLFVERLCPKLLQALIE